MRWYHTLVIIMLLSSLGCILNAKKAIDTTAKGLARLEKYDIAYTDSSFFKYLLKDNKEVIQDFLDAGYDVNKTDEQGEAALLIASERNLRDIAALLLERGATVDITDADGSTPLMYAAFNQNSHIVKLLMDYKADINKQNYAGWTPLMFAIEGGDANTIDALITLDTDLTLTNHDNLTPKQLAREHKYYYLCKYMDDKISYLKNPTLPRPASKTLEIQL